MEKCKNTTTISSLLQVIRGCGNNLHEVLSPSGDQYLVSMPTKFRRSIWIKRGFALWSGVFRSLISQFLGDYLIVTPIEEGNKVRAEIHSILLRDQIRFIKEHNQWWAKFSKSETCFWKSFCCRPKEFEDKIDSETATKASDEEDDDDDDLLTPNTNRVYIESSEASSDESDSWINFCLNKFLIIIIQVAKKIFHFELSWLFWLECVGQTEKTNRDDCPEENGNRDKGQLDNGARIVSVEPERIQHLNGDIEVMCKGATGIDEDTGEVAHLPQVVGLDNHFLIDNSNSALGSLGHFSINQCEIVKPNKRLHSTASLGTEVLLATKLAQMRHGTLKHVWCLESTK